LGPDYAKLRQLHVGATKKAGRAAPRLETPRLLLRSFEQDDVEAWARIMRDPEVMRYLGAGARYRVKRAAAGVLARFSDIEARAAVAALMAHWAEFGFGEWAVEERETGSLIGKVGLIYQADWDVEPTRIEIGWSLAPEVWGNGYATEGAREALAYAFDDLGIERLISICRVDHHRSENVMRRLNMSLQGTTRWKGGRSLWYAADRETWQAP
jgi:RimJ/RimL family protein N-acetyltransferase